MYKQNKAARSKLTNFAPKISWCAQLAVLSIRHANIVHVRNMILQALNHDPTACLRAFQCEQHVNRCGTAEIHVRNADGENSEILQQQSCGTTQQMFLWNVFVFIYKISDINSWRFKRNILTLQKCYQLHQHRIV